MLHSPPRQNPQLPFMRFLPFLLNPGSFLFQPIVKARPLPCCAHSPAAGRRAYPNCSAYSVSPKPCLALPAALCSAARHQSGAPVCLATGTFKTNYPNERIYYLWGRENAYLHGTGPNCLRSFHERAKPKEVIRPQYMPDCTIRSKLDRRRHFFDKTATNRGNLYEHCFLRGPHSLRHGR